MLSAHVTTGYTIITIIDPSCHNWIIYLLANYSKGHKDTRKLLLKFTNCYTFIPIYGSKPKILGIQKPDNFLTSQKLVLISPQNGQSVTYSKFK